MSGIVGERKRAPLVCDYIGQGPHLDVLQECPFSPPLYLRLQAVPLAHFPFMIVFLCVRQFTPSFAGVFIFSPFEHIISFAIYMYLYLECLSLCEERTWSRN